MDDREPHDLRVLVADESRQFIEPVSEAVRALGHEVCALEVDVARVGRATHEHRPDIAIVALHDSSEHALGLITEIVDEATCPVCLLAPSVDRDFLAEAARRGVFAYLDSTDEMELRGGIDIAIQRYHQFRELLGAFGRRARIERAKGLLMERHGLAGDAAFERIRREARSSRRPLMDVVDELLASSPEGAGTKA
jgi:AmiR/NasT family two-component response regulator